MAICFKRRARYLIPASLIILSIPFLLSISQLDNPQIPNPKPNPSKKSDHLILGPAAGVGIPNRLQCQGTKAVNGEEMRRSRVGNDVGSGDAVSLVTVFSVYGGVEDGGGGGGRVRVGNVEFSKVERAMAVVYTFVDFLKQAMSVLEALVDFVKVSMPKSNVIILTDPASDFSVSRNNVQLLPIEGDYSRGQLMLQRIKSYIAFLQTRMDQFERQMSINHYIFTDSDVAVVDDLGHVFQKYPQFHLALTFRNNKDQPLNSGFIAVRGTKDGILKAKNFLEEVLDAYISNYMKASRMLGDQLAIAAVIKSHVPLASKRFGKPEPFSSEISGASVLFLPCALYNWTPPEGAGQFHGMPLDVQVVHFKGSRKRLMLESWNFFNSTSNIPDMLCLILKSGRTKYDF